MALAAAAHTRHGLTFLGPGGVERRLSYEELYRRARRVAGRLVALGVQRGDRVGVAAMTSPQFMDAFFGVVLAGAVPAALPATPWLGSRDAYEARIAGMLTAIGARLVLVDDAASATLASAIDAVRPPLGGLRIESVLEAGVDGAEVSVDPEALVLLQFSSGSTRIPKAVAVTHRALMNQSAMIEQVCDAGSDREDRMVSWLPLYHDLGLIGCLLAPLYFQSPVFLMAPEVFVAQPSRWLRAISHHQGTLTMAPNFAYELCMRRIVDAELEELDLRSLRIAFNGAEPVSAALVEAFVRRFGRCGLRERDVLRSAYGLAEATLAVSCEAAPHASARWLGVDPDVLASEGRVTEGHYKVASVGAPLPGVSIAIRDDHGGILPERRVGQIIVRSPSRMRGYFGDARATARVLSGDWLDTGDLGFADAGELYITGRAKELVIIRGCNYPPRHFEECLDDFPRLRRGRVVAAGFVPNASAGEELIIIAECRAEADAGSPALVDQIRKLILDATGIRAHTVLVVPPGSLRLTSSGKLCRGDALQRALAGEFTGSSPA